MIRKLYNKIRLFFGFKRKLSRKWSVEKVEILRTDYGIDAAEELAKILTEEINS